MKALIAITSKKKMPRLAWGGAGAHSLGWWSVGLDRRSQPTHADLQGPYVKWDLLRAAQKWSAVKYRFHRKGVNGARAQESWCVERRCRHRQRCRHRRFRMSSNEHRQRREQLRNQRTPAKLLRPGYWSVVPRSFDRATGE